MITTTLISSCHWKTLVLFCFREKRPENAFLTVTVYYICENRTEKQIMLFKTIVNWIFNEM